MPGLHPIESRSLALHEAVARHLLTDPALWDRARGRLEHWRANGERHPHFLSAWDSLMDAPVSQVAAAIVDPGDQGQRLRRASPFAFVLPAAERWAVWRAERQREVGRKAVLKLET